jgi:hypothetical protein
MSEYFAFPIAQFAVAGLVIRQQKGLQRTPHPRNLIEKVFNGGLIGRFSGPDTACPVTQIVVAD